MKNFIEKPRSCDKMKAMLESNGIEIECELKRTAKGRTYTFANQVNFKAI